MLNNTFKLLKDFKSYLKTDGKNDLKIISGSLICGFLLSLVSSFLFYLWFDITMSIWGANIGALSGIYGYLVSYTVYMDHHYSDEYFLED